MYLCIILRKRRRKRRRDMKILIIEDEKVLSDSILSYLKAEKYLCEQAFDYNDALMKVRLYDYDCVLLDLTLPGGDGLDILRDIKQRNSQAGVIIVSAKDSLDDKIRGLEIGADDYLSKPFHLAELSIRIYAVIRRREFGASNVVENNGIRIDLLEKSVVANGNTVSLTKSEYDLLLFFIGNRNRILSKNAIAEHLSGEFADVIDNFDFIYAHIKNLKSKLAACGVPGCIQNIYGMGYKWENV